MKCVYKKITRNNNSCYIKNHVLLVHVHVELHVCACRTGIFPANYVKLINDNSDVSVSSSSVAMAANQQSATQVVTSPTTSQTPADVTSPSSDGTAYGNSQNTAELKVSQQVCLSFCVVILKNRRNNTMCLYFHRPYFPLPRPSLSIVVCAPAIKSLYNTQHTHLMKLRLQLFLVMTVM